ncbi:hypothetical protein HAP94_01780 [Acidithiobacillus ferrivorans]|nr:hypothetical protein [Acidithiobacillus ferrivorans]
MPEESFDPDDFLNGAVPASNHPASDEVDPDAFAGDDDSAQSGPVQEEEGRLEDAPDGSTHQQKTPPPAATSAPVQPEATRETAPVAARSERQARLKTLFEQVIESQPPERAAQFHQLKATMGLRDDDALWGVIAVLDIHLKLFETIPENIAEAAIQATDAAKAQALVEIQSAIGQQSELLMKSVSSALETRSVSLFLAHLTWYGTGVLFLSSLIFSVGFAAGSRRVPPWMMHGILQGVIDAPLAPVAGAALVATGIFPLLRGLGMSADDRKSKGKKWAMIIASFVAMGVGVWMMTSVAVGIG